MKKRLAFVSNSSSSSYVCCVSGQESSGWDMGLDDAGMYQCENGHVFLQSYVDIDEIKLKRNYLKSYLDKIPNIKWMDDEQKKEMIAIYNEALAIEDDDEFEEFANNKALSLGYESELSSNSCPVCTFKHIIPEVIAEFLMLTTMNDVNKVKEMIKNDYVNYTDMLRDIKQTNIWCKNEK